MGSPNDVYLPTYNEPEFISRRKILTAFPVLVLTAISVRVTVVKQFFFNTRKCVGIWKILEHFYTLSCFRSYSNLNLWYDHFTVTVSETFADANAGDCTNTIETTWNSFKYTSSP
ncbi:LOW QUALITY PROTEIN: hypothetical protein HZS_5136 [Henneguya salminicola]|nr:LOW QUALITY PROTEIN: hypothetical protein HZS_5136 [Henneguya salminicola]